MITIIIRTHNCQTKLKYNAILCIIYKKLLVYEYLTNYLFPKTIRMTGVGMIGVLLYSLLAKLGVIEQYRTCRVLSMGTQSMRASYIFLFLKADLSMILRKVWRSSAHREPSEPAWMVAARGWLYSRASSPKLPLSLYVWISFCVPSSVFT